MIPYEEYIDKCPNFVPAKPKRKRIVITKSDFDWWNSSLEERAAIQKAMEQDHGKG